MDGRTRRGVGLPKHVVTRNFNSSLHQLEYLYSQPSSANDTARPARRRTAPREYPQRIIAGPAVESRQRFDPQFSSSVVHRPERGPSPCMTTGESK